MSCKYNNSMYTITPPEDEVEFDYLEQILLSEDYETQEEIDHRLADEYKQFQIYELSDEQMLEFARAGELAYGGKWMFTPEFWKNENKIGNALYRINQSPYKDYCEIDELFVFLAQEYPEQRELFETLYAEYAEYVEEQTRLRELKDFLNTPGMKKEVKYKVLEAQLWVSSTINLLQQDFIKKCPGEKNMKWK